MRRCPASGDKFGTGERALWPQRSCRHIDESSHRTCICCSGAGRRLPWTPCSQLPQWMLMLVQRPAAAYGCALSAIYRQQNRLSQMSFGSLRLPCRVMHGSAQTEACPMQRV